MDSTIAALPATFLAISAITVKVVTALNFSPADEVEVTTEKNNDMAKTDNPIFLIFHAIKESLELSNICYEPVGSRLNFKVHILLVGTKFNCKVLFDYCVNCQ